MSWSRAKSYNNRDNYQANNFFWSIRKKAEIKEKYNFKIKHEIENFIKTNFPQFGIYKYCSELSLYPIDKSYSAKIKYSEFDNKFIGEGGFWEFEINLINEEVKEIIKRTYSEKDYNLIFGKV